MESLERAPLHIHDECQSRYEKLEAKLKKLTEIAQSITSCCLECTVCAACRFKGYLESEE